MSSQRRHFKQAAWRTLAVVLLFCLGTACAADKDKEDKGRDKKKPKAAPADLFNSTTDPVKEQEARDRIIVQDQEKEIAARNIQLPSQMDLDIDWYSPHIRKESGIITRGWVKDEMILVETDKKNLIAIRRTDGYVLWQCMLDTEIRYAPVVTRNNVVVNNNNKLVAVARSAGNIRWKLMPTFVMSCEPLVIDPPSYPREYTRQWQNLENVYVGGWDGRFYALAVRAKNVTYVQGRNGDLTAPEFDLLEMWHKTHPKRGVTQFPVRLREDMLNFTADDHYCYVVTRDGEERDPYYMLGVPSTGTTVTTRNFYTGARDNTFYALDRLTLRKKWSYNSGYTPTGNIMPDEPATPLVYVPTSEGLLHALLVNPAKTGVKGQLDTPETYSHAWEIKAAGSITAGPEVVYLGLDKVADQPEYKGIAAVDKATGKVLWENEGGLFGTYLEFHNTWSNPNYAARVYALTTDNRVVALKEKIRDTGVQVAKLPPPPETDTPKVPAKKAEAPKAE